MVANQGAGTLEQNLVLVLGIDVVRRKNLYQAAELSRRGYDMEFFATSRGPLSEDEQAIAKPQLLHRDPLKRMLQVLDLLWKRRRQLHHVEVYVGGRFAFLYVLSARCLRVPVLVVERGDLKYYASRQYGRSTRLSMWISYRFASYIWYKEPYMEPLLRRIGNLRMTMLPNAVPNSPGPALPLRERGIDFLWVNRLLSIRNPEWFARAILDLSSEFRVRAAILGFTSGKGNVDQAFVEHRVRVLLESQAEVELLDYTDPLEYYQQARFFVLPSDIVFCNFALLEAMSFGIVPIVSDVEGSSRIVQDGRNGLTFDHSEQGLLDAMRRALVMDESTWSRMSSAAANMVRDEFGVEQWADRLEAIYQRIAA